MLVKTNRVDVDTLAEHLARAGALAHSMPPAWEGAGVSEPFHGLDKFFDASETPVGHVLDGKGLLVGCDLKALGITKPIPHVYEKSLFSRLRDTLHDDRAAITTYDGIIAARASGQAYDMMVSKLTTTTVANQWSSIFRAGGVPAGVGTYANIPGGAALDCTNAGALNLGMPNISGSNLEYLLTFGAISIQQINMFLLVDLLVAAGNILATVNTSQTVNSTALTRYTSGAGVYMTFDVTTALGSTASNLTATYTNQAGAGSKSTGAQALNASAIVQRLQPVVLGPQISLAAGDYGVQSVQSVVMSAANSAGVLAVNLYKPLVFMPGIVAAIYAERDSTTTVDGLVQIATAAGVCGCLAAYVLTNTTSTGITIICLRSCFG